MAVTALAVAVVASGCSAGGAAAPPTSASPVAAASPSAGASSYTVLPVIVSSEQVVGSNRFLFSFLDQENRPAGSPDRTATVTAYPKATGPSASVSGEGTFVWSIPDEGGYYVTRLAFSEPGEWIATFDTSAPGAPTESIGPFSFDVKADGNAVQVGEAAPSVKTPTLDDVDGDVALISTDKTPDLDFYRVSVDEALAAAKPFVLVFATPAFCTSAACGPLLDTVKSVSSGFADLTVINVEPYHIEARDGTVQPVLDANGQLQPVEAVDAFGILSEPWLFVVDGAGKVSASIEGVVGEDELRTAIEAVVGS
jgi:hypothetical protein